MPVIAIKRPEGMKRPRAGLIDRRALKSSKVSKVRFVPFGETYPGIEPRVSPKGGVDPTFKTEVESLLRENAELLRRLAR